ncbi:hypothetical protein ACVXHA_05660 [Escherichia coli]
MTNKKLSVTKQSKLLLSLLPVRQLRSRLPCVRHWRKIPQKIFNYIQLTPVRKEGIVGYAVKPGRLFLFDASGFKEGDIAIALNQQDFTDPRAMIALMRQLPSMDSIQLTVLRKGARHDISIALR